MGPIAPSPCEATIAFQFAGEDALYRDHHGRRVIADVFGLGRFAVDREGLEIWVDEAPSAPRDGRFDISLLVVAPGPGAARVDVMLGRTEAVIGEASWVEGPWPGCGWVVGHAGQVEVDGLDRPIEGGTPNWPSPFFLGIDTPGPVRIVTGVAPHPRALVDFAIDEVGDRAGLGWRVQNLSAVEQLESTFANGVPHRAPVASHLNGASFLVDVPQGARGLLIRRTYDAFHGRQRARVRVAGRFAGWWYAAREDRSRRWRRDLFGVPGALLRPGAQRVEIDPPAGVPLWSVSRLEAWSL